MIALMPYIPMIMATAFSLCLFSKEYRVAGVVLVSFAMLDVALSPYMTQIQGLSSPMTCLIYSSINLFTIAALLTFVKFEQAKYQAVVLLMFISNEMLITWYLITPTNSILLSVYNAYEVIIILLNTAQIWFLRKGVLNGLSRIWDLCHSLFTSRVFGMGRIQTSEKIKRAKQ